MGGGGCLDRVGRGPDDRRRDAGSRHHRGGATCRIRGEHEREDQRDDRRDADDDHERSQPRMPVGRPVQQDVRPCGRGGDRGRQDQAGHEMVVSAPQMGAADTDDGSDRRRKRHRVVRVDDPLGEAQRDTGDDQPATPEQERGTGPVGAQGAPAQRDHGHQDDQRRGDEPGDLTAHLRVEYPGQTGLPPAAAGASAPADAAGLVAVEPSEAVVAEDEIEDAVVLRPADIGPGVLRPQFHGRHPPSGGDEHRCSGQEEPADPAPQ